MRALRPLLCLPLCAALAACAVGPQVKSPKAAEAHAVALANDRCQQVFGQRPFQPGQFQVALVENRWQWGRQDPAGVNGYSAVVSFLPDRSDAQVEVFFSLDENGLMESGDTRAPEPSGPHPLEFSPEEF